MNRRTMPADQLLLHADFLRRLADGLVRRDEADDLCQDTWVAALRRPPLRASNLRGWLQVIARNLGRNRRREQARRRSREQAALAPASGTAVPAASEIAAREEVRRRVVAAVLQLPEPLRDVVLLRFYEGLDSNTIGARLERPSSTVRTQLQSALERLRARLDGEHGEGRAGWALPLSAWARFGLALPLMAKTGWPVRVAVALLVILLGSLLLVEVLQSPPPPAPGGPGPVLAAEVRQHQPDGLPAVTNERQPVEVASANADRGPDTLWGRVVLLGSGNPVPRAEVQLQYRDADQFKCQDREHARKVTVLGTAQSDGEGRFRFKVTRAHQHRLRVSAPGCAPVTVGNCTGGAECIVEVGPGAALQGIVREQATSTALAGVPVQVRVGDGELGRAVTDAGGSFVFRDLPAGNVSVSVPRWNSMQSASQPVTLAAGQLHQVDVALAAGRSVHGIVTDAISGTPLAGVQVSDSATFDQSVLTDATGQYRLTGLYDSFTFNVVAQADGYAVMTCPVPPGPEEARIDLALVRGGTVCGRFVDGRGAPVPGVYAAAGVCFIGARTGARIDWLPIAVDSGGRFQTVPLDPGLPYQIYARALGFGARIKVLPRRIAAGLRFDLGDIVLSAEGLLEGTVVDADGLPFAGAHVTLNGTNSDFAMSDGKGLLDDPAAGPAAQGVVMQFVPFARREVRSAADGSFRFAGLATGNYEVSVLRPRSFASVKSGPHEVRDGTVTAGIRVAVAAGLSIRGRIRAADGRVLPAMPDATLFAHDPKSRDHHIARVAADGTFVFDSVGDGEHVISLTRPPAGLALSPILGVRAGSRDVDVVLQAAATVEGRVVDRDGRPLRAKVSCYDRSMVSASVHETCGEGRFRLEVPPDFAGKVRATDPVNQFRIAEAQNVLAGARDLVLTLR